MFIVLVFVFVFVLIAQILQFGIWHETHEYALPFVFAIKM